jgi:hypothetical protein
MIKTLQHIWASMRPKQWIKNIFVFAALVFDRQLISLDSLWITLVAAILFCLASSLVYIINDLADIESDRQHPTKKDRPLPAGQLSKQAAITAAVIIGLITLPPAFLLDFGLGLTLTLYLVMMLAYSFWLKHYPLVDVMIIAAGFVLRVTAGVIIIETQQFSPWLFVSTVFWRYLSVWASAGLKSNFSKPMPHPIAGVGWVHLGTIRPVINDCPEHHLDDLLFVHLFCNREARQLLHDADHPFCDIWPFPLFVLGPHQAFWRGARGNRPHRSPHAGCDRLMGSHGAGDHLPALIEVL